MSFTQGEGGIRRPENPSISGHRKDPAPDKERDADNGKVPLLFFVELVVIGLGVLIVILKGMGIF
jgi:hypothetical protein